jgi:hypothetical protein
VPQKFRIHEVWSLIVGDQGYPLTLRFCLPRRGIGSATSITIDFLANGGPLCPIELSCLSLENLQLKCLELDARNHSFRCCIIAAKSLPKTRMRTTRPAAAAILVNAVLPAASRCPNDAELHHGHKQKRTGFWFAPLRSLPKRPPLTRTGTPIRRREACESRLRFRDKTPWSAHPSYPTS